MADLSGRPAAPPLCRDAPEWRPYRYRGADVDTLTPPELQARLDADDPDLDTPAAWPHGAHAGWKRHEKAGEPPCEYCRLAVNRYNADRRANRHQHVYGREVVVVIVRECECGEWYLEEAE